MFFPWNKYEEKKIFPVKTLQIFITNNCNLKCNGCFARNVMNNGEEYISKEEYESAVKSAINKGVKKINLLGGEPFLHPDLPVFTKINSFFDLKTTIYTNGSFLNLCDNGEINGAKVRVSIYSFDKYKGIKNINKNIKGYPIEFCFMVSKYTTVEEMIESAKYAKENFNSNVFFISSLRELDNCEKEFFTDTDITMPVIEYKKLVHRFLIEYDGNMEIHVSKRGVFESTVNPCNNKCNFSNYFIGGKVIQCPYDIVNLKFQENYDFNRRYCQHNNSCLMSKVVFVRK